MILVNTNDCKNVPCCINCLHTQIHTYVHKCTHKYTQLHKCTHKYTHTHVHMHRHIHTQAHPCIIVQMSMYIEACESGSLFQGLLEDELHLYVTTAANANESSWGTYCPGVHV